MKEYYKTLKDLRKERGLTQKELAEKINMRSGSSLLGMIESGTSKTTKKESWKSIIDFFNLSVDEFAYALLFREDTKRLIKKETAKKGKALKSLEKYRKDNYVTQIAFAERIDIDVAAYNRIENDKSDGALSFWMKLYEEPLSLSEVGYMYLHRKEPPAAPKPQNPIPKRKLIKPGTTLYYYPNGTSCSAKEIVLNWKKDNPEGTKADCAKQTGLNRSTVYRWWDADV